MEVVEDQMAAVFDEFEQHQNILDNVIEVRENQEKMIEIIDERYSNHREEFQIWKKEILKGQIHKTKKNI